MDWKTILTTVMGAGLVTTLLTQVWGSLSKQFENRRHATYLAIRIATILERFAIECAERIANRNMYDDYEGHAGSSSLRLPELASFPDEENWNTLQPRLLARVLTLPNEQTLAHSAIDFWRDVDTDSLPTMFKEQCGKVGYIAWMLACDLREQYRFPRFDPKQTSWDIVETLKANHDDVLRRLMAGRKPPAPA
jgi:hypothetical protein